ncbi:MAG: 16S rRNA (guanine(966)-N(2))-methyltransferase RsmD [Candidatus Binatia bacterium]
MRVIGGNARGQRLKVPKGQAVRPTSGRVKEALFNILPHDLSGMKILELFAGTGNVTIEAISRGAAEAILIDSSPGTAKIIRENLRRVRFVDRTKVWVIPVSRALRLLARRGESFDLIFLDPPYQRNWVEPAIKTAAQGNLLRPSGTLIVEHSAREGVKPAYSSLVLSDQRSYGGTLLSFFKCEANVNLVE